MHMIRACAWCSSCTWRMAHCGPMLRFYCIITQSIIAMCSQTYRKANLNSAVTQSVYMEVSIQGRLCHPHILGLYAAFEDSGFICIVSGLAEDSDLYRRLPDIRRDERILVKHVVGPLVSAVATMHMKGVLHRDLKASILLSGARSHQSPSCDAMQPPGCGYKQNYEICLILMPLLAAR